ncbi:Nucleolar protein 13 [Coemansia sp. BCRC 34490]|nr:Nucleolar protein 13 [Coemansia sp. BCRC 34490]
MGDSKIKDKTTLSKKEARKAEKAARKVDKEALKTKDVQESGNDADKVAPADGSAAQAPHDEASDAGVLASETNNAKSKDKKESKKKERSEWSAWIGNMPYTVTRDEIKDFFKDCGTITRIHLPKKEGKALGFAYVDFESQNAMSLALAYSEQLMGKRAVLIKSAKDFKKTGTPSENASNKAPGAFGASAKGAKRRVNVGKNPPSPTLFLGNLSFDVKRKDVKSAFGVFGEIVGVRVATFEDNPEKCRGFGYVDFRTTEDATKAIMSPEPISIYNRRVRMEYAGEEATRKGRPWEYDPKVNPKAALDAGDGDDGDLHSNKKRKLVTENMAETKLQGLPVQYEGEKITFG